MRASLVILLILGWGLFALQVILGSSAKHLLITGVSAVVTTGAAVVGLSV